MALVGAGNGSSHSWQRRRTVVAEGECQIAKKLSLTSLDSLGW